MIPSLQAALGTLLLEANPQHDARAALSMREAWMTVLDQLPSQSFDPTQPITEKGDPWVFLFMEKHHYYRSNALTFFVKRYGDTILTCRNNDGQTPLEKVFEECVRINESPNQQYAKMPTAFLQQVMELVPLDALRTPEDGQDPPGSGWLERIATLKNNNVDTLSKHQPEKTLMLRGANPNHRMADGQPVANLLVHGYQLAIYLEGGLDVTQSAQHPLSPQMTVYELLDGRSPHFTTLLHEHSMSHGMERADNSDEKAPVLSQEEENISYVGQHTNKVDTLASLKAVSQWEKTDNSQGIPLVWMAVSNCPSVVTELVKPKMVESFQSAIKRTDAQGRSPWFHYLREMEGRSASFKNGANAAWVMARMPPVDEAVRNGQGLYEQILRDCWTQYGPGEEPVHSSRLYQITPHPSYQNTYGDNFRPANPLDRPLMEAGHELWWGTPEAQQQLARDLLIRLGQAMVKNPNGGHVELPNLAEILGDPKALHPELVGVLGVVNFVNRVKDSYLPETPILPFKETRLESYDQPLGVTQHDVIQLIHPLVNARIEQKRVRVEDPQAPHKSGQSAEIAYRNAQTRAKIARQAFEQTIIVWRDFSAKCLAVGPAADAPQRRRMRS